MKCYIHEGRLYRTKAEAPAGAEIFIFPDDQQGKIDLVNRILEHGSIEGSAKPARPIEANLGEEGDDRWRVYGKGLFAFAVMAPSSTAAMARAIELLEVRKDHSFEERRR